MSEDKAFVSEHFNGHMWITTFQHTDPLHSDIQTLTCTEFQSAIQLAVQSIHHIQKSIQSMKYQEALAYEIKKHQDIFEEEKQRLLSQFERTTNEFKSSLEVAEFTSTKVKEQFETLKKNTDSFLKQTIDQVVKEKESSHRQELQRFQESQTQLLAFMEKQTQERITESEARHKEMIEEVKKVYKEREEKLKKDLEKTYGSSDKGKQGEKEFDELVSEYTKWPPLLNTSGMPHATDRRVKIRNCETLFEIKNYSHDVKTEQVKKFERDMEENSDCPLGIFISMNTNIVGKKSEGYITCSWSPKSQLLVYINSFYSHSMEETFTFLNICTDIAWKVYKTSHEIPYESTALVELQTKIETVKIFIQKELKRMGDFLTTLTHDKKFLMETITKQNASYVYNVQQTKQSIEGIFDILFHEESGKSEEPEKSGESNESIVISTEIEKPRKKGRKPKNPIE